jgi:CHAT domain-containing protein
MSRSIRLVALLLACLCFASPVWAQSDDEFETVVPQALSPEEAAVARARVLELPAAGASQGELLEFFHSRKLLGERLGELPAIVQFTRNWIDALPNDWQGHWHMAKAKVRIGDLMDYFPYARSAIRLAPNRQIQARLWAELASKYLRLQGDAALANSAIAQAQDILNQIPGKVRNGRAGQQFQVARSEAKVYLIKGELESFVSQYDKAALSLGRAVAAAQRSLELAQQMGDARSFYARNELVSVLSGQASTSIARGALFDADQSLKQALVVFANGDVSANVKANLYSEIANLRVQEGRFREGEHWARKGLDVMVGAGAAPSSAPMLTGRSAEQTALAGQGRWQDAWNSMAELDRAVQGNPQARQKSRNPQTRALVLLMLKRYTDAEIVLAETWQRQKAYFGADHFTTALTEGLLAWAQWENENKAQAQVHFDHALQHLMTPQGASTGYEEQGLRKLARKSIAEAYLKSLGSSADATAQARGFAVADWLAGSSVQQALSEAAQRTRFADPRLQEALRSEQDIQRELDTLYRYMNEQESEDTVQKTPQVVAQMRQRVTQLSMQREKQHQDVRKLFPAFDQMVRPSSANVRDIAAQLGDDEVFVQVLSTSIGTHLWAIDHARGVVGAYSQMTEPEVVQRVARMRATLDVAGEGAGMPRFDFAAANELHDALVKPLAGVLGGKRHLIISTSGALAQVPFSVLVTQPYDGDPGAAPWLIRQLAISHVPGAGAWMALKQLAKAKPAALAFMGWGDPLFGAEQTAQAGNTRHLNLTRGTASASQADISLSSLRYSQIPPLPETRAEVQQIALALRADLQKDAFFGKAASRDSVLLANANGQLALRRVIVFATHGLVPGDLPNLRQPALAMAANGATDAKPLEPLLTLEDVLGLRLNADWVVLSACNTAAAEGQAEEALSGLARGFFYAGSRSLLVTHWSVESASASLLTTQTFAHQMAHPQERRAESLRAAMLEVMAQRSYSHPAYWAPYALVGEGGR